MNHLPPNELYTDAEVIRNLERNNPVDDIQIDEEHPTVIMPMPENENIVIEDLPDLEVQPTPKKKKTVTAKNINAKKRKLVFEVPPEEKLKCVGGKWTYNYQGGETYCVDGFSYTINNHTISKKTGSLSLYLICTKCGGRNVLSNVNLKKHEHPGHTCPPDPDNWQLFEVDLRLKSLGE